MTYLKRFKDNDMDFIELVHNLNNRIIAHGRETSTFQLDKIICSHPLKTTMLGYAPSLLNDFTIVPDNLRIPILMHIRNRKTIRWVNKKYMEIINRLVLQRKDTYKTDLVRLHIAACMATSNNIVGLTSEEKEEWRQHITSVFFDRNLAITDYYIEEILKLPF